jgi:hypothetical protein
MPRGTFPTATRPAMARLAVSMATTSPVPLNTA